MTYQQWEELKRRLLFLDDPEARRKLLQHALAADNAPRPRGRTVLPFGKATPPRAPAPAGEPDLDEAS